MTIDLIIILIYLLILPIVSIYNKSKNLNFTTYGSINKSIIVSKLLMVATIFTSSVGAGTIFGITEKVLQGDLSYSYALMMIIPIDILVAIYFIPKINAHQEAQTIGDIMTSFYGLTGRYIAGAASIIVCIGFISMQISACAYIFEHILDLNWILGLIFSYTILMIYSTIGGLRSIIIINLIQFCIVLIAIPIITIFGIKEVGISQLLEKISLEIIIPNQNNELGFNVLVTSLSFLVMNLYPTLIQRSLINKNTINTVKSVYIKSSILAIFLLFITLNGLIGSILVIDENSNLILPALVNSIVPIGFRGIVILGLLSAVMSTADADLNIASLTAVNDFFIPIFNIKKDKNLLLIVRITNIFIGSLSIIIAIYFNNIIDILIFITGFWGPVILIPFCFGLFNIIISKRLFMISSFFGALSFLIWEIYFTPYYHFRGVFIGTIVNFLIFILSFFISSFNKKS